MTANAALGSHAVHVADASQFKVGDVVQVYAPNDPAFVDQAIPASVAASPYLSDATKAAIAGERLPLRRCRRHRLYDGRQISRCR